MVVVEVEIVTLAKERHPLKVASSMLLTDAGMATLVNALQLPKAKIPILVTDVGMSTLANERQPSKANLSMLLTDEGMPTLVNAMHPQKAELPILVTDVGIVTLVTTSLFLCSIPHSRHESCRPSSKRFG